MRYLGLYVMCYLLGAEMPDAEQLVEETKRSVQGRARVLSMRKGGRKRVL